MIIWFEEPNHSIFTIIVCGPMGEQEVRRNVTLVSASQRGQVPGVSCISCLPKQGEWMCSSLPLY